MGLRLRHFCCLSGPLSRSRWHPDRQHRQPGCDRCCRGRNWGRLFGSIYLKIQADPAPATPPSALQQGKASFVQERQGTLLRSGKLDRRLPTGEDVPSAAPPSGKRPQGMDIHKQPRQVSGQAGGSRVQSKPHRETPRQAMGGTAKTAVKERGAPVKQAAHPVRQTGGTGGRSCAPRCVIAAAVPTCSTPTVPPHLVE